mmetsp:Transcript_1168/g.2343  ORF Transcript_1168/g.2343 Transcript_1168/m.2343 type:complete len:323 (-) Transcript_1168:903-1871(-)
MLACSPVFMLIRCGSGSPTSAQNSSGSTCSLSTTSSPPSLLFLATGARLVRSGTVLRGTFCSATGNSLLLATNTIGSDGRDAARISYNRAVSSKVPSVLASYTRTATSQLSKLLRDDTKALVCDSGTVTMMRFLLPPPNAASTCTSRDAPADWSGLPLDAPNGSPARPRTSSVFPLDAPPNTETTSVSRRALAGTRRSRRLLFDTTIESHAFSFGKPRYTMLRTASCGSSNRCIRHLCWKASRDMKPSPLAAHKIENRSVWFVLAHGRSGCGTNSCANSVVDRNPSLSVSAESNMELMNARPDGDSSTICPGCKSLSLSSET